MINFVRQMIHTNKLAVILASTLVIIIVGCLFGPWLVDINPRETFLESRLCPPSIEHPGGCDKEGRDVIQLALLGGRISLMIAFVTVISSTLIGTIVGLLSGYLGGRLDLIAMRIIDLILSLPQILIALVVIALIGGTHFNTIVVLATTGWAASARLVRGQVLSIRNREFVQASKALGANLGRILFKHILPQAISPIIVQSTFSIAGVIIVESSLSFLGLSSQSEVPTWGAMLSQGKSVMFQAPHLSIVPGLLIFIVVLSLNMVGDALRDYLDPKSHRG